MNFSDFFLDYTSSITERKEGKEGKATMMFNEHEIQVLKHYAHEDFIYFDDMQECDEEFVIINSMDRLTIKISAGELFVSMPLWHRFYGHNTAQDGYLVVYPRERIAKWSWEKNHNGMTTFEDGVGYRIPCDNCLTSAQILNLSEKIVPLLKRMCDGFTAECSTHGCCGTLNADATSAKNEIERILENTGGLGVANDAEDWLDGTTLTQLAQKFDVTLLDDIETRLRKEFGSSISDHEPHHTVNVVHGLRAALHKLKIV